MATAGLKSWWRREFEIRRPDDYMEKLAFRRRFRTGLALLLVYRGLGTVTNIFDFSGTRPRLSDHPEIVVAVFGLYSALALTAGLFTLEGDWEFPLIGRRPIGRGIRWIDRSAIYKLDVVLTVALNVFEAALMKPGTIFNTSADLVGVANITVVMLWTARRGGRQGLRVYGIIVATMFVDVVVNRSPWDRIDWWMILTRVCWVGIGYVLAILIIRLFISFARAEHQREVGEQILARWSRVHDHLKPALERIAEEFEGTGDERAAWARRVALAALSTREGSDVDGDLQSVMEEACRVGNDRNPGMKFNSVDGIGSFVRLRHPEIIRDVLARLTINAAEHSHGRRTNVRAIQVDGHIEVVVRDNGKGLGRRTGGHGGITGSQLQLEEIGCELELDESFRGGTRWILRLTPTEASLAR